MRLSNLVYGAIGYTLGARAGKERYEAIVRVGRRVAGSQTVQASAGVARAQFDTVAARVRNKINGG